ncbi:hypothetical protein B0H14DRAFT_3493469 [Mycena olivaceomarginata]|nr:hypothetical protein B0H14DRAFT_3493469 [Mycena olivaceomarginata]
MASPWLEHGTFAACGGFDPQRLRRGENLVPMEPQATGMLSRRRGRDHRSPQATTPAHWAPQATRTTIPRAQGAAGDSHHTPTITTLPREPVPQATRTTTPVHGAAGDHHCYLPLRAVGEAYNSEGTTGDHTSTTTTTTPPGGRMRLLEPAGDTSPAHLTSSTSHRRGATKTSHRREGAHQAPQATADVSRCAHCLRAPAFSLRPYADSVPPTSPSKGVVTRRYLLRDSKTNATLRLSRTHPVLARPPRPDIH